MLDEVTSATDPDASNDSLRQVVLAAMLGAGESDVIWVEEDGAACGPRPWHPNADTVTSGTVAPGYLVHTIGNA